MKKIIATVLAMVMALALCTNAMAATTYGDFYKWDGGWVKQNMDGVSISYTAASESKTDGKLVSATRGYFTLTGDNVWTLLEEKSWQECSMRILTSHTVRNWQKPLRMRSDGDIVWIRPQSFGRSLKKRWIFCLKKRKKRL